MYIMYSCYYLFQFCPTRCVYFELHTRQIENESDKDSSDLFHDVRHKTSSATWNEEFSPANSSVTDKWKLD